MTLNLTSDAVLDAYHRTQLDPIQGDWFYAGRACCGLSVLAVDHYAEREEKVGIVAAGLLFDPSVRPSGTGDDDVVVSELELDEELLQGFVQGFDYVWDPATVAYDRDLHLQRIRKFIALERGRDESGGPHYVTRVGEPGPHERAFLAGIHASLRIFVDGELEGFNGPPPREDRECYPLREDLPPEVS